MTTTKIAPLSIDTMQRIRLASVVLSPELADKILARPDCSRISDEIEEMRSEGHLKPRAVARSISV